MRTRSLSSWFIVPFGLTLALAGSSCANSDEEGDTTAGTPAAFARTNASGGRGTAGTNIAPSEQAAAYSAQEVGLIVAAIRTGERTRATLGRERAVSPLVRAYASRLAPVSTVGAGEGDVQVTAARGRALAHDPGTTSTAVSPDPLVAALAREQAAVLQSLQKLDADAFDAGYISSEVSFSAKTLALIDHALMPSILTDRDATADLREEASALRDSSLARLLDALQTQALLRGRVDVRDPSHLF